MTGRIAVAAAAALLLPSAGAFADQTITAGGRDAFTTPSVTIAQGESLLFRNLDVDPHNVTASQAGPDGRPLFASATIGAGQQAPVQGAEYLHTGRYAFLCSVHPFMTGTLMVSAEGTPKPRPAGTGGAAPASGPAPDTTPPAVRARRLVARHGRLRVRVTVDEPATVKVVARAGRRVIARRETIFVRAGTHLLTLRVRRRATRIDVRAIDASGNAARTRGRPT